MEKEKFLIFRVFVSKGQMTKKTDKVRSVRISVRRRKQTPDTELLRFPFATAPFLRRAGMPEVFLADK